MKLTPADLESILAEARRQFVEMPAETRLEGMPAPMNQRQRRALSFFYGVVSLLNSRGKIAGNIDDLQVEVDYADSDTIEVHNWQDQEP